MGTTTLGVKLDQETRDRLKTLGQAKDRTPHWLVKAAIQEYLEREEQAEREYAEDEVRWQNYRTTGYAVANEEAMAWLDALAAGERKPCPR
jgi:Predicted transcriptional regulator